MIISIVFISTEVLRRSLSILPKMRTRRSFIDAYASPVLVVDLDFDSVTIFIDELIVVRTKLGNDLALKHDASVIG